MYATVPTQPQHHDHDKSLLGSILMMLLLVIGLIVLIGGLIIGLHYIHKVPSQNIPVALATHSRPLP